MANTCILCGVELDKRARDYCIKHRHRGRIVVIDYDPSSPYATPQPTPCRTWRGSINKSGYGMYNGRAIHRWVWITAFGPIPKGMVVMHLCDNPPCYRLDHLRLGTIADNNADRDQKGRYNLQAERRRYASGTDHPQARLTPALVAEIRRQLAAGAPVAEMAIAFDVGSSTVYAIKDGRTWRTQEAGFAA